MPALLELDARPIPADVTSRCQGCGAPIVWATTLAGPNGPGGKLMPLDPYEDLAGNVAATNPRRGVLRARVLQADESVDRPLEFAAMTHFATCATRTRPELPADVVELQAERAKRRGRRR